MEENNGKMKKIEASFIKGFRGSVGYLLLAQFWISLIILSLSLSHTLGYLYFS